MAYTIAKQAKLSEDEISEIRAKVRPQHGASDESQGPLADAGPGARRHQTYVERLGSFLARVGHPSDIAAPGSADRTALPTAGSIGHCNVGGCAGKDD